jgi:hypothetical protein
MTTREQIEQQVRELLANETRAIPLSNQLFSQEGLFAQLGTTAEERRALLQSPLYREARRRVAELEKQEAEEFARVVAQTQAGQPESGMVLKLERVDIK